MPDQLTSTAWMDRRGFLLGAGAAGMTLGTGLGTAYTQIAGAAYFIAITRTTRTKASWG